MIRIEEYELLPDFVKGADELKAKKTCCKSACMNCPFGHTIKKHSLMFKEPSYKDLPIIKEYLGIEINQGYKDYELVVLKGYLIAVVKVDKLFVIDLHLHPLISNENVTAELIESYYFY